MFGSVVLEVVLGLVFVYAWFSLACSAIVEFLESLRAQRGKLLAIAVERMLGPELKERFYQHGLIQSLSKSGRLPSYLPTPSFSRVTLDLLGVGPAQFRQNIDALSGEIGNTLRSLAKDSASYEHLVAQLDHWFDSTMDRCSGWFRRRARLASFLTGLAVATMLNVDSLEIVSALYSDTHLRLSMVTQAELDGQVPIARRTSERGPTVMNIPVESGTLPLGWENSRFATRAQWADHTWSRPAFWFGPVLMKVLGLIVTALAGSLGSAFWFDALKRLLALRTRLNATGNAAGATAPSAPTTPGAPTAPGVPTTPGAPGVPSAPSAPSAPMTSREPSPIVSAPVLAPSTAPNDDWSIEQHKPRTLIGMDGGSRGVEIDPIVNLDAKRRD